MRSCTRYPMVILMLLLIGAKKVFSRAPWDQLLEPGVQNTQRFRKSGCLADLTCGELYWMSCKLWTALVVFEQPNAIDAKEVAPI